MHIRPKSAFSSVASSMVSFDAAFTRLTGHSPFRWQRRLFDDWFRRGMIPEACDLPTGLGKTATMAVWLIARAGGAALPRRLIYVVDRRAVVDQATRFAEALRDRASTVLGIDDLRISTLRGRFADNRRWLEAPDRLAIVVGTIDMIGSRLLFCGYGVSKGLRPYHAGFIGVDALVVLDESHLCPAFESLIDVVAKDRDGTFGPLSARDRELVPPLRLMSLSATRRDAPDGDQPAIFTLENEDRDEPRVRQRISATKRLYLQGDMKDPARLPSVLAERAWSLGTTSVPARVVIYCDKRSDATDVKKQLDKRVKENSLGASELLVGARRVNEREALDEWLRQHGFVDSAGTIADKPTFLVATSAGEVGVDLDADHMVCDLVAWERMVQRLGRVNRRGASPNGATIEVVPVLLNDDHTTTLSKLRAPFSRLPQYEDGSYDASSAALGTVKSQFPVLIKDAMTPPPLHPALTRALVDAWSLTNLDNHSGRPDDIQPWLRGWQQEEPHTTVVWRRCLPWGQGEPIPATVNRFFSVARVHLLETLEASADQVFTFLTKRATATLKAAATRNDDGRDLDGQSPVAIVLDRKGTFEKGWRLDDLIRFGRSKGDEKRRALESIYGRTVVVSTALGGLDADGMLDDTAASAPSTLDGGWSDDTLEQIGYRVTDSGDHVPDTTWKLDTTVMLSHPEANERSEAQTLRIFVARDKVPTMEGEPAIARGPQKLREHHDWTEKIASQIVKTLRLPGSYATMLSAVARYHDLGKERELWQNAMNAPTHDRPYAKIGRGSDARRLNGYRHEFGSLHDVETIGLLRYLDEDTQDLALHLIAAHHGRSRPTIPSMDPTAAPSEREMRARNTSLRFARQQRRWGPWGLAWWETLLRSSDQRASARLSREDQ